MNIAAIAIFLIFFTYIVLVVYAISQKKAHEKWLQSASVEELENALVNCYNTALKEDPKRGPKYPRNVRDKADAIWRAVCNQSEEIVAQLKKLTGKDYKSARTICAEVDLAKLLNSKEDIAITTSSNKNASVVKRAIVGGVIAGPVGAIVGAASAIDNNMKNSKL